MKLNMVLNTPVNFYIYNGTYSPETGPNAAWEKYTSRISETETMDCFWVNWTGAFGAQALEAQAQGVSEMATLRMNFDPVFYDHLRKTQVLVIKGADPLAVINGRPDKHNINCYQVWTGIDNVQELNRFLEFKVKRYEAR